MALGALCRAQPPESQTLPRPLRRARKNLKLFAHQPRRPSTPPLRAHQETPSALRLEPCVVSRKFSARPRCAPSRAPRPRPSPPRAAPRWRSRRCVSPPRLSAQLANPPRWVRFRGLAFARGPRARPRGRERAESSRGARASGAASARLGDAPRCDATRADSRPGEITANGPHCSSCETRSGRRRFSKRFPSAALTTYRTLPDFPNAKTRRRTTRARGVSPPSPVTTSPRWTSSTPRDWS